MLTTRPIRFRLSRLAPLLVSCAAAMALAGCATGSVPRAIAELKPASGSQVWGMVWFTQERDHIVVRARVSGLTPNQEHGFHVHEKGDCSSPDASSAGGHLNPGQHVHGPQNDEHHEGDLPSLKAGSGGVAQSIFEVKGKLFGADAGALVGKALVVHENPDDYATQPSGNSGKRVACGVIVGKN